MVAVGALLMTRVAGCYGEKDDPSFEVLLGLVGSNDDESLADLIEADGRLRIHRGLPVTLERYFAGVPELERLPAALDAAIDMALRSASGSSRPDGATVDALVSRYPRLETAIREAAQLNGALWSTEAIKGAAGRRRRVELPFEFGPLHGERPRYLLRSLLGSGTGGDVYLGVDRKLSEQDHEALVAVKVLAGPGGEDDSLFFDEATKARRVLHPNVVRIEDCGVSAGGERYIVYEHLPGGDLQRFLADRGGRLPARDAAALVAKVARGVHAAHRAGLIHCDIKPGNVLLDERGEPKVADFGVAQRRGGAPEGGARPGPVGNVAFMSPEQYRGDPGAITTACDVYALGGLLYCLVTGRLPNGQTPREVEMRLREDDPSPPVLGGAPGVDGDLDAIGRRAMAARAEERHESAAALAEDLERWLGRLPLTWRNPGPARRAVLWARRRPGVAALAAALLVLLAAGAGTGTYLYDMAQKRRIALLEIEAQAAAARANYAELRVGVDEALNLAETLESMRELPIPRDLDILPESFFVEMMYGSRLLSDPVRLRRLFRERREIARGVVSEEEAAGRGGQYKAMTWRIIAGYWELLDGDATEAARYFGEAERQWGEVLGAEDPMRQVLASMRRASELAALLDSAPLGSPPPEELRAQVAAAAEELWRDERRLAAVVGRGHFHLAVVRTLGNASAKRWNDDRTKRGRIAELLDEYGELAVVHHRPRG